ncbi:MAG: type IV toxin-antitoxin system AbiEi family antitoxin domain-containing protein [Anaerolineae bacterium]|nr:type IV toxin-antitoxin system AbiEi family antitoxin domain-containing protein [Anaerolineae bacterium]
MSQLIANAPLYEIAEQQGGYFSAQQARRQGISKSLLAHHVKQGRLLRLRRGVYRLAHFPEMPHADLYIAWLAAGDKAVLSHESALLLYGLTDLLPDEIHLTVPRTASRRLPGVRFHTARLRPEEINRRYGLPLTTLPRTITDLIRSGVAEEWVQQAIQQALARGLTTRQALEEEARRRGGRVAAQIRATLENANEVSK